MQFVTVRDFRNSSRAVWDKLNENGELVVTSNGKPTALLLNVGDGDLEKILRDVRRARLMRMLGEAREEAAARGFLSDEEIIAEIAAARAEHKEKTGKAL